MNFIITTAASSVHLKENQSTSDFTTVCFHWNGQWLRVVRPRCVLWQLADRMTCLIMWAEDGERERGRGETGSPLHITPLSGPELSSMVLCESLAHTDSAE